MHDPICMWTGQLESQEVDGALDERTGGGS